MEELEKSGTNTVEAPSNVLIVAERVEKDARGRFMPGNTIGQAGKPKGSRHMATLLREAITKVVDDKGTTIDKQILRALYDKAKKGDLKATEIILDRIDGKPLQEIDITSGGETIGISAEQRAKLDSLLAM